MDKLDFVDTHVHFYDLQHPELVYEHWQPGVPHPVMGWKLQKLAERNYIAEDYIAETRNANVDQSGARASGDRQPGPGHGDRVAPGRRQTGRGFPTASSRTPICAIRVSRECWSDTASPPTCGAYVTSPTATT